MKIGAVHLGYIFFFKLTSRQSIIKEYFLEDFNCLLSLVFVRLVDAFLYRKI